MEKHLDAHWSLFGALSLIIAGGIGNLADRIALGFVTDMFDFRFFPVFNIMRKKCWYGGYVFFWSVWAADIRNRSIIFRSRFFTKERRSDKFQTNEINILQQEDKEDGFFSRRTDKMQ